MNIDYVFHKKREIGDFKFDRQVAHAFDDMLERSVPFYIEIQRMVLELVERFKMEDSNIYDLGCSTGTLMLEILKNNKSNNIKIMGVDYSKHMIDLAHKKIDNCFKGNNYELKIADLNKEIDIKSASVVLMILTLQFVDPANRDVLIKQIYKHLFRGGCLIIIEKVLSGDKSIDSMFTDLYYDFKKRKGYSNVEIDNKEKSLTNVLIPLSLEKDLNLLRQNGFKKVETFFKWYNFAGIIGIKE